MSDKKICMCVKLYAPFANKVTTIETFDMHMHWP